MKKKMLLNPKYSKFNNGNLNGDEIANIVEIPYRGYVAVAGTVIYILFYFFKDFVGTLFCYPLNSLIIIISCFLYYKSTNVKQCSSSHWNLTWPLKASSIILHLIIICCFFSKKKD